MTAPGYPVEWEADALLRDGHPVHLRPITPEDGPALRRFHSTLSARTVYFRFFAAKPELSDADVAYFTGVDHVARVAMVVLDHDEIGGVGRFDVIGDGSAEVAFLIRDDLQGHGLGSILLEHLAAAARERGVTRFVAEVLPENSRMLATFREAGYQLSQRREEDVIAVSFEIEPTASSRAVTASREHRAEARSVQRLLHPRSVAVVGASRRAGGLGHQLLLNLVDGGFTGQLLAVHPEVQEISGVRCVPALAAAGTEVDVAVVVVPAEAVPAVMADAEAAGVHALVIVSGGFGDAGPDGLALQSRLVADAHRTGMRLVGPNALGLINTAPDVRLNASLVPWLPDPGCIGFFCQSGALGTAILDRFRARGLGLSTFVSAGNRADISGNDLLQYWEEDPSTDVVLLYLESIGNARKFARLVHGTARHKTVAMVRTGGAGHAHPSGHAVASTQLTQRGVDQILADCGLIVVDSVDALLDIALLASSQPLPASSRVAVVGNSDALAILAVNAMTASGLVLARPPDTLARQAEPIVFEKAVRSALDDPSVGAVVAIHLQAAEQQDDAAIHVALDACAAHGAARGIPLVAVMPRDVMPREIESSVPASSREAGTAPVFDDVERAVHALDAVAWLREWRERDAVTTISGLDTTPVDDTSLEPGVLEADAAARLLSRTGKARPAMDPDVTGTVGCHIRLIDDPLFGPVVAVGVDDPVAELLEDTAHRLAPVSAAGARAMLDSLGAVEVLRRGASDAHLDVLANLVSDVSALHLRVPGVVSAVLRQASVADGDEVLLGEASITVAESALVADPAARRL